MSHKFSPRAISTLSLILIAFSSSATLGAELTTQAGDVVVSSYSHNWDSDFTLPDGDPGSGGVFDIDGDPAITNIINFDTDEFDYGVEGETLYQTNASSGATTTSLELDGPVFAADRFEINGYANTFSSNYGGQLRAGTGALAPQPVFMPWTLLITPEAGENTGDPVLIKVIAGVSGFIGANGVSSSAAASWAVNAGGIAVLNDGMFASKGGGSFTDDAVVTFPSTIGATFDISTLYTISINGDSSITGADSGGRFDETSLRVLVLAPACIADLNCDGAVDAADLGILLGAFGSNDQLADINNDGIVDAADLGILLGGFGAICN